MINSLRNFTLILLLACAAVAASARDFLGIDGEESTSIGIYIKDIRSGKVLVDHNSQMALTPASILKCVTTATALQMLGPDYRFTTSVSLRGSVSKGVLNGDLIINGVADPTLESSQFKHNLGFCNAVVHSLQAEGINKISGDIIIEQNLKKRRAYRPMGNRRCGLPLRRRLFGLNWRDNTFTLFPLTGVTKPYVPDIDFELEKSTDGNELLRGIYSDRLIIRRGDISSKKLSVSTTMPDPAAVLRAELLEAMSDAGITVSKRSKAAATTASIRTLLEWKSPDGAAIMRSLMVRSDNLFAEGILRAIAPGSSRKDAIKKEKEFWNSKGISARYTIINDGSGLTRANRLSAHFIGDVLEWMAKSRRPTLTPRFPQSRQGRHYAWIPRKIETERTYCTQNRLC